MIELREDELKFSFSEVHEEASLTIGFQRTLRIPTTGGNTNCRPASDGSRYDTLTTFPATFPPTGSTMAA